MYLNDISFDAQFEFGKSSSRLDWKYGKIVGRGREMLSSFKFNILTKGQDKTVALWEDNAKSASRKAVDLEHLDYLVPPCLSNG